MSFAARRLLVAAVLAALAMGPIARAQSTRTWTGSGVNNLWTTPGNWDSGVPGSGDTAQLGITVNDVINLGGTTQPIKNIFLNPDYSHTIGVSPGDKFNFDAGGAITVDAKFTQGTLQTINADVQTNGSLTITNNGVPGSLRFFGHVIIGGGGTLSFNNGSNAFTELVGSITDFQVGGQPGSLSLLQTTPGSDNQSIIEIEGTNGYTGATTIQVNTGNVGSIEIGSDLPFGSGPVTVNLVAGSLAPQFVAVGAIRTIGNPFYLNSGMTFYADSIKGGGAFVFTGPITIINSASGGTRTLTDASPFGGLTLGAAPGSSTITLGNPVANGGDGIGKGLVVAPSNATYIINDVMKDPAPGGGTHSGIVQYGGAGGSVIQINSLNTYSGRTLLNGSSTIQFSHDFNAGDPSGPFGLGTLTHNNSPNNILEPVGGNRTIANPMSMIFGITVANATGDTSSLTLTGPITMSTTGRTITNNFTSTAGSLILGSATSPSTITLPTTASQTMTIAGTGTTVINDVIQNPVPVPSPAPAINVTNTGTVAFNGLNTYTGDTTFSGTGTIFRIGASSNGLTGPSFTAGPFGTGTRISASTPTLQPYVADRTVANAITMTFGIITSTAAQDPTGPHNLTLTGPITLGSTGRFLTNNIVSGVALTLGSAVSPSTISLGSTLTIRTQVAGGGATAINDAITGSGGLTVQDSAVVQLNGTSSYGGTTSVTGTGTPKLLVNGSKTGTGMVTIDSVGTLGGSGSISGDITNNGKIAPGNSVGTLTATGNVTMGANSHLAIELSGGSADKLVVGGNLNLSNVDFLDVSASGGGTSWVIATYGSLTGTFNNVTTGYTVNYGTGTNSQITLNANPSGVKGDFNNDGKVDAGDYATWRKNNGTNNALPNDNGLGTPIGPSHYTLWRTNYGKPPGSGLGSAGVPEPMTRGLALVGLAIFGVCRRER